MLLAQITDLHIVRPGALVGNAVDTAAHLARAVARIAALVPRPDAVVVTGDLVEHGEREEYEHLRALLEPLPMPAHLLVGNHDQREPFRAVFGGAPGFVQHATSLGPVRLVALDTLEPGQSGGQLCAARLAWLEDELASAAARAAEAIVVAMHHPPFTTGIAFMDRMGLDAESAARLAAIVARHPKIERVLCGHIHRPIHARFAGTVASVAPSVAHQLTLQLDPQAGPAVDADPPGFTLHLFRPGAGLVTHLAYTAVSARY